MLFHGDVCTCMSTDSFIKILLMFVRNAWKKRILFKLLKGPIDKKPHWRPLSVSLYSAFLPMALWGHGAERLQVPWSGR